MHFGLFTSRWERLAARVRADLLPRADERLGTGEAALRSSGRGAESIIDCWTRDISSFRMP